MIRRGDIPETWEAARRVISERLDAFAETLDRGFRARDQFRDVRELEIDTGALPVDVQVSGAKPPLAVLCLRAMVTPATDGQVTSGAAVLWEWREGAVRIHGFDALSASTRYLVTLAVME